MAATITLRVNGKSHAVRVDDPDMPQAVQCGYCINGMIMQAKALLDQNRRPTEAQIREALAANLCRCGTHLRIVRAVKRASESMA
jgi:nicotinate dehydrogenase subunit A